MARRRSETGRKRPAPSEAKKARALPLVAEGRSQSEIADAVGVSRSTVRRWMDTDPAFSEAVTAAQDAGRRALEETTDRIAEIVSSSLESLAELVKDPDPKIRLDAVKTALDRFGHPVASKAEATVEHTGDGGLRLVVAASTEDVRALAREED